MGWGCESGVHYTRLTWGDHGVSVKGRVRLDLVRDAGGEVCAEGVEGVCELGVDLVDTCVEYGVESCEKPCSEVLGDGVERVR